VIQLSRRVHLQTDIESHTHNGYHIAYRFKGTDSSRRIHCYRTVAGSDRIILPNTLAGQYSDWSAVCVCLKRNDLLIRVNLFQ